MAILVNIFIRFLSSIPSPIIAQNEWVQLELYTGTGKVEWALNTSRCTSAPESAQITAVDNNAYMEIVKKLCMLTITDAFKFVAFRC